MTLDYFRLIIKEQIKIVTKYKNNRIQNKNPTQLPGSGERVCSSLFIMPLYPEPTVTMSQNRINAKTVGKPKIIKNRFAKYFKP